MLANLRPFFYYQYILSYLLANMQILVLYELLGFEDYTSDSLLICVAFQIKIT